MSDIRTVMFRPLAPGEPPRFDYQADRPALLEDEGLETAIIISLFTDRRANHDDALPDGGDDRRGWWADAFPELEGDRIGSRLWLLFREKDMQSVVNRAREYTDEALAWLVQDGVAQRIVVQTGWVDRVSRTVTESKTNLSMPGVLGIAITVYRPNEPPVQFRFDHFWRHA